MKGSKNCIPYWWIYYVIIKEKPMKRHEYREMKFWKSLTNNDYGIVAPLDQKKNGKSD